MSKERVVLKPTHAAPGELVVEEPDILWAAVKGLEIYKYAAYAAHRLNPETGRNGWVDSLQACIETEHKRRLEKVQPPPLLGRIWSLMRDLPHDDTQEVERLLGAIETLLASMVDKAEVADGWEHRCGELETELAAKEKQ